MLVLSQECGWSAFMIVTYNKLENDILFIYLLFIYLFETELLCIALVVMELPL